MSFELVDYSERSRNNYTALFKDDAAFDALCQTLVSLAEEHQVFYGEYFDTYLNIDKSFGQQLDVIGGIVGQPRILANYISAPYFGFQDEFGESLPETQEFDNLAHTNPLAGEWRSVLSPTDGTVRVLDDDTYKIVLKARIIKNSSNCSLNSFLEVINLLTGNKLSRAEIISPATVLLSLVEPVNPLVDYFIARRRLSDNILPIPLGVRLRTAAVMTDEPVTISCDGATNQVNFFGAYHPNPFYTTEVTVEINDVIYSPTGMFLHIWLKAPLTALDPTTHFNADGDSYFLTVSNTNNTNTHRIKIYYTDGVTPMFTMDQEDVGNPTYEELDGRIGFQFCMIGVPE